MESNYQTVMEKKPERNIQKPEKVGFPTFRIYSSYSQGDIFSGEVCQ